jgi:tetratricopeptide (TPR) repeat protein
MANIELRDYIAEIEQMLAAENNSEAIAHCRHILNYFPKNLAIYRLLGKGLLEQRQFADAANVFYRVLSATPDDFVAHLGLAIIGEEEGNLNQSIGHMARAFETQPNNGAIQEELKRLYGRRDGVAPTRIRLTRGGLARLYVNGGNYAQAVEELRAALKETPERIDLQILLAKALWYDEQRIDAVQVCQGILQHLPYSLEANAILYEIWQSTDREEEAVLYRQRVEALDPFLAQELGSRPGGRAPQLELPRLDYVPTAAEEIMGVPAWVKDLGLHFDDQEEASQLEAAAGPFDAATGEAAEAVPDWLRDMVPSGEEGGPTESGHDWEAEKALEEAVPNWLRDAGLLEDDEGEPVIEFDEPKGEETRAPAEMQDEPLPTWLTDAVEWESKKKGSEQPEGVSSDDWLLELDTEEPNQAGEAAPAAELYEPRSPQKTGTSGFAELSWDQIEDQLGVSGEESVPEPPEELTAADEFPFDWQDWKSEEIAGSTESIEPEVAPDRIEESAMPQSNKDQSWTPGEGDDLGEMPSDPEEAMKWLERLAASQGAPLEELPSLQEGEKLAPAEDMPDWLKEIAATSGHTPGPIEGKTDAEEPGLPDWLQEDTFAPTPAEPARPHALGTEEDEFDLPDWLKEEFGEDEEPVPSAAARQVDALPKDSDEALAWLEELTSSSQAATPETTEEPGIPDWLKAELIEEDEAERPSPKARDQAQPEKEEMPEDIDEAMAWLESLAARQGTPVEELTTYKGGEAGEVDLPDWLKTEFEAADVEAEPELRPAEEAEEEEELPDWLREPAEEPTPAAKAEEPEIPDWLREAVTVGAEEEQLEIPDEDLELPAWLREEAVEEIELEAAEVEEAEEELPDWLREETLVEEPPVVEAEAMEEEVELPDWLRKEAEEEIEEAEVAGTPATEEEMGLPEWLSEELWEEPAELAQEAEIEPALVEEELELPDWLRDEFYEEPVEVAEAELAAEVEEPEIELPEWLRAQAREEVAIAGEAEGLLEEEAEPLPVEEVTAEGEIEVAEKAPEAVAVEEAVQEAPEAVEVEGAEAMPPEEVEVALVEEPEAAISEEAAKAEIPVPAAEPMAEEVVPEPEEAAPVGIAAFREQLAIEPDDHITRLALARALVDDLDWDQALSHYSELIAASHELDEVIEDLDHLLESRPRDIKAQTLLGDACMKQGDLDQALEAYRRALGSL